MTNAIEYHVREELRRSKVRWSNDMRRLSDVDAVNMIRRLRTRRLRGERFAAECLRKQQDEPDENEYTPPVAITQGTGGGRRVIRSTKPDS